MVRGCLSLHVIIIIIISTTIAIDGFGRRGDSRLEVVDISVTTLSVAVVNVSAVRTGVETVGAVSHFSSLDVAELIAVIWVGRVYGVTEFERKRTQT